VSSDYIKRVLLYISPFQVCTSRLKKQSNYLEGLTAESVGPLSVGLDDGVVIEDLGCRLPDQPRAGVVPGDNANAQRVESETVKEIKGTTYNLSKFLKLLLNYLSL